MFAKDAKGFMSLFILLMCAVLTSGWDWNPPQRYVLVRNNGWKYPPEKRGWEAPPPPEKSGWEAPPPPEKSGWEAAPPPEKSGWEATPLPEKSGWEAPPPRRNFRKSSNGWGWKSSPPQTLIDYPFTIEYRNGWKSSTRSFW